MATKKRTTKKAVLKKPTKKASSKKSATNTKNSAKEARGQEKISALDAAAQVLADSKQPMTTKEMIQQMAVKKLRTSPDGATPHATLYSAILREINAKGERRPIQEDRERELRQGLAAQIRPQRPTFAGAFCYCRSWNSTSGGT